MWKFSNAFVAGTPLCDFKQLHLLFAEKSIPPGRKSSCYNSSKDIALSDFAKGIAEDALSPPTSPTTGKSFRRSPYFPRPLSFQL